MTIAGDLAFNPMTDTLTNSAGEQVKLEEPQGLEMPIKGFGVEDLTAGIIASGAILHYLKDTEHPNLQHITSLQRINRDEHLWMDRFTIRNLELINHNDQAQTLFKTINNTISPMGARLLKRWMLMPLNDIHRINERLNAVDYFIKESETRNNISQLIKQAGDIERLAAKVPLKKINPREVLQTAKALQQSAAIKDICVQSENEYLKRLGDSLNPCQFILDKIIREINDNPPALANKGGMIASGTYA
jgi:DNA mismatch repair protein MutS